MGRRPPYAQLFVKQTLLFHLKKKKKQKLLNVLLFTALKFL
jgi:hypothetical protein